MIFVPDTNVLSEGQKSQPDAGVVAFLRSVPVENIRLSSVVLVEIAQGVENNPTPQLQTFLADCLALPLADFGEFEALEWGRMTSAALNAGHSVDVRDSFIAATANVRKWVVATRNVKDFEKLGVQTFNPWTQRLKHLPVQ